MHELIGISSICFSTGRKPWIKTIDWLFTKDNSRKDKRVCLSFSFPYYPDVIQHQSCQTGQ
jgi:hypothetical protein